MPLIRYEVTLSQDAQRHPTAFAPVPASTTSKYANDASQGWTVHGEPGTSRIPAPYSDVGPSARPGSPLPGGSGGGGAAGSRYLPPAWYPSLYWARQTLWGAIGGVAAGYLLSGRGGPSPVPTSQAVGTTQVPGMLPRRPQWLKGTQVAMPPNAPRWARRRPGHARPSVTVRG